MTLEGLGANGRLDPVQPAFIACGAAQCGYCLNGMIMTARALIDINPEPTDADIREALRCPASAAPSDVRGPTLSIICEPCRRRGRYNVERLMAVEREA
jgi:hypothetical protein